MPTPSTLTGQYQLAILGPAGSPDVEAFSDRLVVAVGHAIEALGVNHRHFLVTLKPGSTMPLSSKMPAVVVFFGVSAAPTLSSEDQSRLDQALVDGILIVPVVPDLANFSTMVPTTLAAMNGCTVADCGTEFERLAARVLEGFGLLREKRRIFISYKRIESSGVALQLYESLDAAGFDVFLDTQGAIRPGEPFQEVLWHRLADTDVVVLLDTPDFLSSRWTEEELARANNSNIQMLQILWPGQAEAATAAFSTFHPLSDDDFSGSEKLGLNATLKDGPISQLVDEVEGLRARALGARQAFLIREFAREANDHGLTVRTTLERNLILSAPAGKILVMPAIGVPDAERYETLGILHQRDLDAGHTYAQPPVLLYDQTGIRTRWLDHLGWLNNNIAVAKSLSIVAARDWLNGLSAGGPS